MKNFIFKSSADDSRLIKNVFNKLDMLLAEQRHQRSDLSVAIALISKLINAANLQKQVDEYFDEDNQNDIPEESSDKEPD